MTASMALELEASPSPPLQCLKALFPVTLALAVGTPTSPSKPFVFLNVLCGLVLCGWKGVDFLSIEAFPFCSLVGFCVPETIYPI